MTEMRVIWGCDRPTTREEEGYEYPLGSLILNRCPNSLIRHPWTQQALSLFEAYEKGHLPNGKGLKGETAHFTETMDRIGTARTEAESWYTAQIENRKTKDNG